MQTLEPEILLLIPATDNPIQTHLLVVVTVATRIAKIETIIETQGTVIIDPPLVLSRIEVLRASCKIIAITIAVEMV